MHYNGMVSSTIHQCFKYYKNDQVKNIFVDAKSFTMAEAHYTDTKFYLKDAPIEDAQFAPDTQQQSKQKREKIASGEE